MNKHLPGMTPRERVLAAVNHQPLDRFPTDIWAVPEIWKKLQAYFQVRNNLEVYDHLGIDGIMGIAPEYIGPPTKTEEAYYENEWGFGYRLQKYETGEYYEQTYFPLEGADTIEDLKTYRWPNPDWYDYNSLKEQAAKYPDRAIMSGYYCMFYYHNQLRGLEKSFMDPVIAPDFTRYLLNRLAEFFDEYHRRIFDAAANVIDLTQVTDDFGSQKGLLIGPRMFDQFYRPYIQNAIDLAKSYNILVFHHDDGDIRKLIPRLVEMGINVLNPLQWRCGNWDLDWLKDEFGKTLCFHGGIDNQYTLPFGSVEDVIEEVRRVKRTLGKDGTGLIISGCHNIQALTPVENIIALYETAKE